MTKKSVSASLTSLLLLSSVLGSTFVEPIQSSAAQLTSSSQVVKKASSKEPSTQSSDTASQATSTSKAEKNGNSEKPLTQSTSSSSVKANQSSNTAKNDDSKKSKTQSNSDSTKTVLKQNTQFGPGFYDGTQSFTPTARSYVQDFFNAIKPGAIAGWKKYGVLPSVSAAQGLIESGWGRSQLATQGNNLFGIKGSYNGQSIYFPTQEYFNGHYVTINAAFRKYPNWSASIEDHGRFLAENSRYHNLLWVRDYRTVAHDLQSDGYATDPNYANSLINAVNSYDLTQWDQEAFKGGNGGGTPAPTPNPGNGNHVTNETGTFTFTTTTNIRNAPSTSAKIVGSYNPGDTVHYSGKVQAEGYIWLRYQSYSGETRYVAIVNGGGGGSHTTSPGMPSSGSYTFTTNTNIRNSPSTSGQIVGSYNAGETVYYNGTVQADGYTWLKYTAASGATRYIAVVH